MSTSLVIGGTRGIGLEYVKQLAAKCETVIATVRKGSDLSQIEGLGCKNIKLVYADLSAPYEEISEAVKDLKSLAPQGIDLVIHNAGITGGKTDFLPLQEQDPEAFDKIYHVNTTGLVKFYKAIYPVLEQNTKPMKYVTMSSMAGNITLQPFSSGPYGASKAALNYITKQISKERKEKGDIVIAINPGLVETDMNRAFLKETNFPAQQPPEAVKELLATIEKATIEDTGKFFNHDGEVLPF